MSNISFAAIILAAGLGKRMKSNHSKRYKKLLESSKESKAEIIEDVIRDNGPTILSTIYALMSDFDENKQRAVKTWLPSYGPKEIIPKLLDPDEFMDFFEENF